MKYYFEDIDELTGSLIALNGDGEVSVEKMIIERSSAKRLVEALKHGRLEKDIELFFPSITIDKKDDELFEKGQSYIEKDGNRYYVTTKPRNPVKFKGILQTLVTGQDGYSYLCEIRLGSIEFDLWNKTRNVYDDIVEFCNVEAIVYPYGNYNISVNNDI